jgi:LAGLIDADG-like domain
MTTADLQTTEIPRDRYGRPMVMPANGTRRVAYRRATTFVGCLEDTYNLMAWKTRQVAYGMGQRKDLVLAAAAADPDDKRKLNEIAEKATEHAMASASATTGTALHALTERVDRGRQLGFVPTEYEADVAAYQEATAGIEWIGVEAFRVHDDWKVAGTADRIGRDRNGRLRIYDIKGLALGTKLPTPTGWTTMGAVTVGDQVLDADGNPCNVIIKSDTKRIGTFIVTFNDGAQIVCDREHIWWTTTSADREAGRGPQPRSVLNVIATLKKGRQNQHCVPVASALNLPDVDLGIDPYLLGAWLGDGNHGRGVITKEHELFDLLESDGHEIRTRYTDHRNGVVSATIIGLQQSLNGADLLGNKHIPDCFMRGSYHQRLRLLQGLMDTDGTWNTARARATFTSTNKALALGVEELLLSLGQQPHFGKIERSGFGKTVTAYDVEFSPIDLMPFRLTRKAAKVTIGNQTRARRRVITNIEPGPDVETACIGVDSPNHVYLCSERMIPTHNTGSIDYPHKMAMQLAMYARSTPYDIATDKRGVPEDGLDLNRGVIVHLPAGAGHCQLYEIDIAKGWGACLIAHKVWRWRGVKDLTEPIDVDADLPKPATWASLIQAATSVDDLRLIWKRMKECDQFTPELGAACTERSETLQSTT